VPEDSGKSLRYRLSRLFDDDAPHSRAMQIFNGLLAALIVVNIGAVILESVEPLHAKYAVVFDLIEQVATAIFAVEYGLRIWTAVDLHDGRYREPLWGRLKYARGFFPLIDLIAVLPALLGLIGAGDFRVLRLLRLLRMLKLTRHSTVFGVLWSVLREEAHAIAALVFVLCLTLIISGALMYMIEGDDQPGVFTSIPAAMWWAIETVTTVGYGDMVPVTFAGRVLGGIISVVGIGTLALFSGLITAGYMNQLRLRREHSHRGRDRDRDAADAAKHFAGKGHELPTAAGHGVVAPIGEANAPAICPHCGGILSAPRALPSTNNAA
jgi:voltage-gated potassium channel